MSVQPNPLLEDSPLPYALPRFSAIRDEHYAEAFEVALAEHRAELAAIIADDDDPTFENTIEAIERSGRALERVRAIFENQSSANSSSVTNDLEEELAPVLAAHADAMTLDPVLYARIGAVRDAAESAGLSDAQRYLVERYHRRFTLAGAGLDDTAKERLRALNARLSTLTTRFEKRLLQDTNELAVVFTDRAELDGLSDGEIAAAAGAAAERGLAAGSFVLNLVLYTGHPALSSLTNRAVRERVMAASRARGRTGGDNDTRDIVLEITRLRAERAALLGFANHAAVVTADQTAATPERVADMLGRLAPAARRNADAERAALEAEIRAAGEDHPLEAHDWAYYSEKVRARDYELDASALRPYFEAERVLRDGVFAAATRLYGITFTERPDLVAYHPGARVFEVSNEDGSGIGLYILDLYTRDAKRGGAWMNSIVQQNRLFGDGTIVVNNLNVPLPPAGQPTLLTFDEANTLFHEFGHALHGLFAEVDYPSTGGTNVHRDFVEFPSQVNEMWMLWPEVLDAYAVHVETGEKMPAELVAKVQAAAAFNEGFATSEYLAAAILDQAWHTIGADAEIDDVEEFERAALTAAGLDDPAVPPRYSSPYFAHTFSGGYDAGYYSYIWSEVLDADTVDWFRDNGGLLRANGDRFRSRLLGVGGSVDPLEAFRDFRGRSARIEPLLERRGLN